jgi:hypothetical protein
LVLLVKTDKLLVAQSNQNLLVMALGKMSWSAFCMASATKIEVLRNVREKDIAA